MNIHYNYEHLEFFGVEERSLVVARHFEEAATIIHHNMCRVTKVDNFVCLHARDAGCVEGALILVGAQWHHVLSHYLEKKNTMTQTFISGLHV